MMGKRTSQTLSTSSTSLLELQRLPMKRIFDIVFSVISLLLLTPLLTLIGLSIKCTSKGRVFYSQERVGKNGLAFHCYKFRTMYRDAEKRLVDILSSDPVRRAEWDASHKLKDDPRITPLGAFLRRTSLDELPQFWNVLKGNLSIVGPRPVTREEIHKHYGPKAHKVLSLKPGITGLWQISGRSDIDYTQRVLLDENYIDNRSFWLDLKIIILTIPKMTSRKGAY